MESESQVALGPHNNSKYTLTLLEALLILSKASLSRTTDSLPPIVRDIIQKLNTAKLLNKIQSSSPDRKTTATKPTKYTSPDRKTKKRSSPRLSPDCYKESRTTKSTNLNFSKIWSSKLKRLKSPRPHTQTYTIVKSSKIPLTLVKSSKSPSVDRNRKSRPSRSSNSRSKDKNREYLERQLARTVNVCYMNNIKNCIEKLKANYNCNPYLCPVLRQRLHKHRIQYHPELFQDSGMMHECNYDSRNLMDGNEAKTKITLAELGDLTISIETKPISTNTSNSFVQEHQQRQQQQQQQQQHDNTSREKTVCNDNYKIEVEREVRKWLTKIPFHPDDTENTKELKEESIKYLIDKIHSLNSASGEIDYDYEVKRYIENCLEELPIWYPGPKRDRIVFKEGLRENLYIRIKDMNKNFFAKHGQPGSMDFNGSIVEPDYTESRNNARYDQYDPRISVEQSRESNKQGTPTWSACCQRPANSRTSAMEETGKKVNVTLHSNGKASITVDSSPESGQNYILEPPTKLSGAPTDRNINSIGNNYVLPSQNVRKSYGSGTVEGDMYPQDGKYRQERPSTISSKSYNANPYVQNSGLGLENNYGMSQYREDSSRCCGTNITGGESQTNRSGSVAADRRASIKKQNKNYGSNIPNGANFASNRASGNNNEGNRPDWQNNVPYRQDEMKGGPNRIDRTIGRYDKPNLGLGRSGETNYGKNDRSFDNSSARSSNYRPSNIDNARGPSTSCERKNCRTSGLGGQADGSNNADRVSQGFNRSQLIPNTNLRAIKRESNDFARNSSQDRDDSSNSGKFRHIRNTSTPVQEKNRGQMSNNRNVNRSKERRDKANTKNTDYSDTNDTYYDEDSNKNYSKRKKSYTVIKKPKPFDENTDEDHNKHTVKDDDGYNRKKTVYKNIELKASDPSMKCTINSKDLCACPGDTVKLKKTKAICGPKVFDMEKEIADWLEKSSILKDNEVMSKRQVIDILLENISSYMRQPYDNLHRAVLKSKIITVLKRLGLCSYASGKAKSELYKMAEELSNRLIGIQSRIECTGGGSWKCHLRKSSPFVGLEKILIGPNEVCRKDLENDLMQEVKECLYNTKLTSNRDIEEDITQLLIERVELIRRDLLDTVEKDIHFILESADELEESEIINVTNCIIHYARELITYINNINDRTDFSKTISVNPVISGVPSIYTSEHEITTFNTTVTTPLLDEGQFKQTQEEKVLTDEIVAEINTWLTKVPENFIRSEDSSMNKMIIYDLAGEVVNHIKMKQLGPDLDIDKKSFMSVYVYKWLMKFGMLENLNDAEPHTQALVKKLERVNIPKLIKLPQTMDQVSQSKQITIEKQQEGNTEDMIVHEINNWINEQDPAIYKNDNENVLTNEAHEIAEKIKQSKSSKKRDSNVKSWLKRVINQNEHSKINDLSNSLIDRINALPQNEMLDSKPEKKSKTLLSDHEKTSKTLVSNHERKTKQKNNPEKKLSSQNIIPENADVAMIKFVTEYMEHDSQTDDPLTKNAYAFLLKSELSKFYPSNQNESLDTNLHETFSARKLNSELDYVKDISDWLKNLPVESVFNILGNKDRVELVINLAKDISDAEEARKQTGIDNSFNLENAISSFLARLPILPEQQRNASLMIDQLITKILDKRDKIPSIIPQRNGQSIPEFIHDYIQTKGQEVAEDELKLEVWTARLLKEIKKITNDSEIVDSAADKTFSTTQSSLSNIITPPSCNVKLDYANEISDWIKNLPIAGPIDPPTIIDLVEHMSIHDDKKISEEELASYIKTWLEGLPLDPQKEIDIPFLTTQLLNRKNKVNKNVHERGNKRKSSAAETLKSKTPKNHNSMKHTLKTELLKSVKSDNTGEVIVKVVEDWCQSLPLDGAPDNEITKTKDVIKNKLFQKIAELNDNPRYSNNEELFIGALVDEIDELFSSLPDNIKIKNKHPEDIESKLIAQVKEARSLIKNISAGDTYRQNLENTLETSLPNPVHGEINHPGFDLYKSYMTDMFILNNFDHINDSGKIKYEEKIKKEIDKYAHNAQKRNALPLSKERVYNELYGALYKVAVPDKKCLVEEVEEIKTKYEVDDWFNNLPVSMNTEDSESLERNQKITFLAKKLHQMEKEKDHDSKMSNEINKWLLKLPLTGNVDDFTTDLIQRLKATEKNRKCVQPTDIKSKHSNLFLKCLDGSSNIHSPHEVYVNPNTAIDAVPENQTQKSGDILIRVIESWCKNVPLPSLPEQEAQLLKEDLCATVIMKISELNSDPRTFNDDIVYTDLLNEELDKLLSTLPPTQPLLEMKDTLKNQLATSVKSVKSLILDEKARYEYRQDLNNALNDLLHHSDKASHEHAENLNERREDIIDNFIEYMYNKDDEAGKLFYKNKILESLSRYHTIVIEDINERQAETLRKGNQLLVELSKIQLPNNRAMKEEVEEIRMKQEVKDFFNSISQKDYAKDGVSRNTLKNSLAKQLCELEKTGYSEQNLKNMKDVVNKLMKKLDAKVEDSQIDSFLKKIKDNEAVRKAPAFKKYLTDGDGSLTLTSPAYQRELLDDIFKDPYPTLNSETCCQVCEACDCTPNDELLTSSGLLPTRSKTFGPLLISHPSSGAEEQTNNSSFVPPYSAGQPSHELVVVLPRLSIQSSPSRAYICNEPVDVTSRLKGNSDPQYPRLSRIQPANESMSAVAETIPPLHPPQYFMQAQNSILPTTQLAGQSSFTDPNSQTKSEFYHYPNESGINNQQFYNRISKVEMSTETGQRFIPNFGDFVNCDCPSDQFKNREPDTGKFISCDCFSKESQTKEHGCVSVGPSTSNTDQEIQGDHEEILMPCCCAIKRPRIMRAISMLEYCDSCEDFFPYFRPIAVTHR